MTGVARLKKSLWLASGTFLALGLGGCSLLNRELRVPPSLGERNSNYGYIPVDALSVLQRPNRDSCDEWIDINDNDSYYRAYKNYRPLLESLPDLSVRFAVANFTQSSGLSFGPSKVTTRGQTYRAVLDYVNVDVVPRDFWVRIRARSGGVEFNRVPGAVLPDNEEIVGYDAIAIQQGYYINPDEITQREAQQYRRITVPVYVGVGLRLSADIIALEGGLNLASLGAIGAEAQANNLSGTLTVQTLGINGSAVATSLPLPSKLDQTTIENALLSLGSNRATLFSNTANSTLNTTPRIVGIYSPIGSDPRLVNIIYSELTREPTIWYRDCRSRNANSAQPPTSPGSQNAPTNPPVTRPPNSS